jgi:hypothetical protein
MTSSHNAEADSEEPAPRPAVETSKSDVPTIYPIDPET